MREVLLPTLGSTHLLGMWLRFYERWQEEVDSLRVHFNNYTHGTALRRMVSESKSDYLLLIEDDGIIFRPDIVDECFKMIENGQADIVCSGRMSCHPELAEAAKKKYKLDYSGLGDKGPHWWPNFFFCKRIDLMITDLHFEAKGWEKGEQIKELDHTITNDGVSGDTFAWISIQLRARGLKIHEIPQRHSSIYDVEEYEKGEGLWDGTAEWVHLGSMTGDWKKPDNDIESREMEKRLMWHKLCGQNVLAKTESLGVDLKRLLKLEEAYKALLGI